MECLADVLLMSADVLLMSADERSFLLELVNIRRGIIKFLDVF